MQVPEWEGLPVEIDRTESLFGDGAAFRAVIRGNVHKWAGIVPVSREILDDVPDLDRLVYRQLDRVVRPWLYPSVPKFPDISLFPRLERMADRVRMWRESVADWRAHV